MGSRLIGRETSRTEPQDCIPERVLVTFVRYKTNPRPFRSFVFFPNVNALAVMANFVLPLSLPDYFSQ